VKNLTRRQFLEKIAGGVAGGVASGLVLGCYPGLRKGNSQSPDVGATEVRPRPGPLKLLTLGDMHVLDERTIAYPQKVIQAMNDEGGDLVLACGDLGAGGKRAELELARNMLDELKMPYHPVLGNHDALYSGDREEDLFKEVFSLERNSYHFVKKGVSFLAVDHGCGRAYRGNAVRPGVLAWMRRTLTAIPKDRPIVMFSHYPFAEGVRYRTPNSAEVLALFEDTRLLAVVSGHFHGNTERRENGVLMTTTACCSGRRRNHDGTRAKGFRVFRIGEDMNVETEFREVKT